MDIILKQSVPNLGEPNEMVKVRPGYFRNYLLPKGMAVLATDSAKKMLAESVKQQAHKQKKLVMEAQQIADSLKDVVIQIGAKVGESGKIFGSVGDEQPLGFGIGEDLAGEVDRVVELLGSEFERDRRFLELAVRFECF